MPPRSAQATESAAVEPKSRRPRVITPFDEAKAAQAKLEKLELQRQAVMADLSNEAAAMLEALDELRASQPIREVPSVIEVITEQ